MTRYLGNSSSCFEVPPSETHFLLLNNENYSKLRRIKSAGEITIFTEVIFSVWLEVILNKEKLTCKTQKKGVLRKLEQGEKRESFTHGPGDDGQSKIIFQFFYIFTTLIQVPVYPKRLYFKFLFFWISKNTSARAILRTRKKGNKNQQNVSTRLPCFKYMALIASIKI